MGWTRIECEATLPAASNYLFLPTHAAFPSRFGAHRGEHVMQFTADVTEIIHNLTFHLVTPNEFYPWNYFISYSQGDLVYQYFFKG
jgi:hypothetical protein